MLSNPNYLDPLRGRLPALERSIHKYRTLMMVLVIYHAEELKHEVVQDVLSQKRFRNLGQSRGEPKSLKWPEALRVLEQEGILSPEERAEISKLISFRNDIAHEVHRLFADLSQDRFTREIAEFETRKSTFDYDAVNRLRDLREAIKDRQHAQHWVGVISFRPMMFESADRIYRDELKRLDAKIRRLMKARRSELGSLNQEFQLGERWTGFHIPFSPYNQYDNGRLTERGVEICFRLFDEEKSPMAVAHLMRVTLNSVKKRYRQWQGLGGANRPSVDFDALPTRVFYRNYDED